jgi:[protein-PII] uridylyltransferase
VPESAIADYFETMPRRYLTAHSPSQIARHARVVLDFAPDQLMAIAVRERRGGFSELILCTRDVHGLYSNVAGVLTAHHIDILGAHVYTSSSGLALEIYRITTPAGGEGERAIAWKEFQTSLERVLRGETSVDELIRRRGRPVGVQEGLVSGKPESVSVTNEESDFYTIVDVAAADRLGLLHDLTRVIADNGLEVYISKAGRVLDQVTDAFYLKDAEGSKVYDAALIEKLQRELLVAARADADRAGE